MSRAWTRVGALSLTALVLAFPRAAIALDVGGEIVDDARWTGRTVWGDVRSIVTLPLKIGQIGEVSMKPLVEGAIAIAAIGVTIGLDEGIRRSAKGIGPQTGRDIQNAATTVSWVGLGALYAGGLLEERADWRHDALTGGEGALVSAELVRVTKVAFGRDRPDANKGAYRWFRGGDSFVSDAATPHFSVAEAISDAFDHAWWATLPAYATATAVGVGRMGQDRHWASDIVGSAALGFGTEKMFSCFHDRQQREEHPVPTVSIRPEGGGVGLDVSWRF